MKQILLLSLLILTTQAALANEYKLGPGEKITYDVKKFFDIGNASIETKGVVDLDGAPAFLIVLSVDVLNYSGVDKIYLDTKDFFPIRIVRRLVFFGTPEEIIEDYNQDLGQVTITKTRKGETTTETITKDSRLDNVYAFIHRFRSQKEIDVRKMYDIILPLAEVTMKIEGQDEVKIHGKPYNVYEMEGSPSDLKVSFMRDVSRVPVIISGKMGFGKVSFILKDYECGRVN